MKLLLILFAFALSGCVSAGRPFDETAVSQFRVGQTTERDVLATLGQPLSSSTTDSGMLVLTYGYTHGQARAATFIPIVGPLVGGADATSRSVAMVFSPDGILRQMTRAGSSAHSGL
jgi:outer membrane protein assembly factor BamE (lipoprotein component of BamABCDE complex)